MNAKGSVLIVEDEAALAEVIASTLAEAGSEVGIALNVAQAQELLDRRAYDVVLLDLHLPDGEGTEVLRRLLADGALTEVVVLTGDKDVSLAIDVMKLGASDYLVKPIPLAELEVAVAKARERQRLRAENQALRVRLGRYERNTGLITENPELKRTIESVARVGPSDLPVLIEGERGTGKELLARAVHDASRRRMEPFVAVDCASLLENQMEAELFGEEGGSAERMPGLFEAADRGTLFLDEVDQLSLVLQPKLLRALSTGEFSRRGSGRRLRADARLICGTVADMAGLVASGAFRADLYQQINGTTFRIPPLRARPEDILPLALHFLKLHGIRRGVSPRALQVLRSYAWPGNVRELQMVIRRAGVLATGEMIEPRDLPFAAPA